MMSNVIKLASITAKLFKKNLDEEDKAKADEEEKENEKRKRFERIFRIKRNGCEKYMLTLALHERNLENIKVRAYLNVRSKVIIKNKLIKNDLLAKFKTNTEPDSLKGGSNITLLE